ncbi:polymerase 1 [Seminavis robusta]|uniref:Poly [ADP-ribose] polymerase n=1 Tax=Seminavis robusta TaxID=568900 RepID=A0A9N8HRT1_9STRA|nr:polymerase 1 [Seminavis robusta]|eukprot:Sro1616_g286270.1 polymerase 1 (1299) ;mRNA; f:21427-25323
MSSSSANNLPFKVDYAKSGRSKCHTTKQPIPSGTLRLGVMVKSRHFDGMQPNWHDAKAFFANKRAKKRPTSVQEMDGFDDLRPTDQDQIEEWIMAATNTASTNQKQKGKTNDKEKQAVRDQARLVWEIRDFITGENSSGGKPLPTATIKAILQENQIAVDKSADLVKLLADAVVFGVPPVGDTTAGGCCGTRPLKFCAHTCRYVCQAPQAWGECSYSQPVEDTVCKAIAIPASAAKNKAVKEWLGQIKGACGSVTLQPQKRLYLAKQSNNSVAKVNPSISTSKTKKKAPPPPPPAKKGIAKPKLSRATVDPDCGSIAATHHVLDEAFHTTGVKNPDFAEAFPVDLYDTALCQTDLSSGTNSQYKLQILVHDFFTAGTAVHLWRVWGRVGGQGGGGTKLEAFDSVDKAKAEFGKLYKKYTGNQWEDRKRFVKHPGKFYQLDVSYADNNGDDESSNPTNNASNKKKQAKVVAGDPKSKLDRRVQEVVAAFFDKGIATSQMKSLKVDLSKMPLAKITERQLKDAYSVLSEIEKVLKQQNDSAMRTGQLQQLSNQFYSKCPSTNPILIDSMKLLKNQVEMVDELINLMASNNVMSNNSNNGACGAMAPVDEAYERLKTKLTPLDPSGEAYAMLKQYVENTRNATVPGVRSFGNSNWESRGLRLLDAFEVEREGEASRFVPSKSLGNRRLLWHGSRISNYSGILSQGLRIAPPEAPVSGYRFGKGVYFADMLGKSANYCRTDGSAEMFVMACDVSLGSTFETPRDMYMEKPQPGSHSTHALSDIIPNPSMAMQMTDKGDKISACSNGMSAKHQVLVPLGKPIQNTNASQTLSCDVSEFIVYDQAQVQIRYLLRLTTNPRTTAADGAVGTNVPQASTGPRIFVGGVPLARLMPGAGIPRRTASSATSAAAHSVAARARSSDDDSDDDSTAPPKKRQKKSVTSFIRLDREDKSQPSRSGLNVLNCRTFVEGLRLTVVKGDITDAATDAIVLPSDGQLSLAGMVGTKVKQKAGPAFVTEVNALLSVQTASLAAATTQQAAAPVSQLPSNLRRLETTTAGKTIRELATDANVPYLTPFYKVIKKEDVSATKDIICLETGGAFHRGQAARTFLGMASGKKVSIAPGQIPAGAEVFVQSTSHNRKIPKNSAVLLETSVAAAPAPAPTPAPVAQQQRKTLKTSEACVVRGHDLAASRVIFVVSPIFSQQPSPIAAQKALNLAVRNALKECARLQLETVTLPSIGSGRAGYDKGQAAAWIIDAIADYLAEAGGSHTKRQSLQEVCFCLFDNESLEAYRLGILLHEKNSKRS